MSNSQRILSILGSQGEASFADLYDQLREVYPITGRTLRTAIWRLTKRGELVIVRPGVYSLPGVYLHTLDPEVEARSIGFFTFLVICAIAGLSGYLLGYWL